MTKTAIEYGSALYDLAEEVGKTDAYLAQLREIRELFRQNPDYAQLLSSHALTKAQQLSALDEAFSSVEPYLLNFMKILCENGTIRELPDCIREYELRYNDAHGIAEVAAVTAVPLSQELHEKLRAKLESVIGKTVVLTATVDPNVLGGVRLSFDGQELDGTVQRRLDEIRAHLLQMTL